MKVLNPKEQRESSGDLIAYILDELIPIPGTSLKIGLDVLLGLIPGVGDTISSLLSYLIVFKAAQRGAPPRIIIKMITNIIYDFFIGIIPIVGDIADINFRANRRNVTLLQEYLRGNAQAGRSISEIKRMMFWIVCSGIAFLVLVCAVGIGVVEMLLHG